LVHDRPTGGVDQDGRLLHQPQRALVDEVARLRGQQRVERDEVRLPQQRVHVHRGGVQLTLGGGLRAHRVVIEDAHAEAEPAAGDGPADAPEAYHTQRLAVDVGAPTQVPLPGLTVLYGRLERSHHYA